jgi:hypothetical protein
MGTWGTSIRSNDTYADIYGSFFELYNAGQNVKEISAKLIAENQDIVKDPNDSNNFWFALAKAQWECKQLEKGLYDRVKQIIESDADLEVWRNLDADPKVIIKRKQVLEKFLTDLQTEKPKAKAKARKKKIFHQPIFDKGDCLIFKLRNENFGGAFVLEADKNSGLGLNLIAGLRINQPNKPTIQDFKNAKILILTFASWNSNPDIVWNYYEVLRKDKIKPEVIGNIPVEINYDIKNYSHGFSYGGSLDDLIHRIDLQFENDQTSRTKPKSVKLKDYLIKSFWTFK